MIPRWWWALVALSLVGLALVFVAFFEQLPIEGTTLAIDWQSIYPGITGGRLSYQAAPGLRNPPWGLLPLLPVGLFSMRASWGLLNLFTFAVLVISVPRHRDRRRFLGGVLLLAISYPALRHAADGNLEGLIIAGTLLLVAAFHHQRSWLLAVAVLIITVKPQVAFVLLGALAIYLLIDWPPREWGKTALLVALVVAVTMIWVGPDAMDNMLGIEQRGSIMDSSLWAALNRTGWAGTPLKIALWGLLLAATLGVLWRSDRTLSRQKAGFLMTASLLLAPYAAGNTLLSVLAIGVIPLFQAKPRLGLIIFALANLPLIFPAEVLRPVLAWYVTGLLLLIWGVLAWWVVTREPAAASRAAHAHS